MKKTLLILITLFFTLKGFSQSNSYYLIFVPTHNTEQNISKTYFSQIFYCEEELINTHNDIYVRAFSDYLLGNYDFEGYWHPVTQANSTLLYFDSRAEAETRIQNQKGFSDQNVIQTSFTISSCSAKSPSESDNQSNNSSSSLNGSATNSNSKGSNSSENSNSSEDSNTSEIEDFGSEVETYSPPVSTQLGDISSAAFGEDHLVTQSFRNYDHGVELRKAADNKDYTAMSNNLTATFTNVMNIVQANRQYQEQQKLLALAEQERQSAFEEQANDYRREIAEIINNRKGYFSKQAKITSYDKDGTTFEPLYIFFAFSKKGKNKPSGYDYYAENVEYPETMEFNLNQEAEIKFSKIFGIFPSSNGYYPFFNDLKVQMLEEYSYLNYSDYDIKFIPFSTSIKGSKGIIESLKSQMKHAIEEASFYKATPMNIDQIYYLNDKTSAGSSKDYWDGGQVKQKKDVDYWDTETTTPTKTNTEKTTSPRVQQNKTKEIDYWD